MAMTKAKPQVYGAGTGKRAVLFELENVVTDGRRVSFEVLRTVLAERDVKLTEPLYARFFTQRGVKQGLPMLLDLLGKARLSEDKLLTAYHEGLVKALSADGLKMLPVFKSTAAGLKEKGFVLGALTGVDKPVAEALLVKAGAADLGFFVRTIPGEEKSGPTVEAWLKLAKNLGAGPAMCIAVTTSATSAKAALSAGMKCVAVLDAFTTGQDYGGADFVVERLEVSLVERIVALFPLL